MSALEVRSRQGAIQIHVYLTLPYLRLEGNLVISSVSGVAVCVAKWSAEAVCGCKDS